MSLTIKYRLTGTGWSRCEISCGESNCEISAAYLSDALGNLLLCACSSLTGFSSLAFGFDEEPGEYRWLVHLVGPNEISVRILSFEELWSLAPDAEGEVLFSAVCQPIDFAKAVAMAAESVLTEYGLEGYKEKWANHPFPMKQLELLREQVASRQR